MFDTAQLARCDRLRPGAERTSIETHESEDGDARRWVVMIQCHDESGLRSLHTAFQPRIFRYAIGIVRRDEVAHEVVSMSFMQAWTTAAAYDPDRGTVATWLMLIARSRSLDALRRVNCLRQREVSSDEDDPCWREMPADRALEPLSHLERRNRQRSLQRALLRLSPMQRQVVSLTTMDGLSHDEASRCLGIPLGTVKSHAKRGLAALRERYETATWPGD